MPDEKLIFDYKGIQLVAKYKGQTYESAGSNRWPAELKYGFYRFDLPEQLHAPDKTNHIYLFFVNNTRKAVGFASVPENPCASDAGKDVKVTKVWNNSDVCLDKQIELILKQSLSPHNN